MRPARQALFGFVVKYFYCASIAVGLLPFRSRLNRFVRCNICFAWSLLVGSFTMLVVGFSYYRIVTLITYPSLDIVRHLFYYEFVIRFGILTTCYIVIWCRVEELRRLANTMLAILEELKRFNIPWIDGKLMSYGLFKIALVDVLLCFLFAVNFRFNAKHDPVPMFERIVNVYAVFVSAQVSNMCLFTLLMSAYLYRAINGQVKLTIGTLCDSDVEASGLSGEQDFCKNMIVLSRIHSQTTDIAHSVCRILGPPLVLINLNQFVVVTSRIYFVYVSAVREYRHEFNITWNRYLNSIYYVIFEIIHLLYLVSTSARSTRRAEKTFVLLTEFFETDVDKSINKNIRNFMFGLMMRNQSISLCGLYKLDFSLLLSMVAAIALKLVVLIQLQLVH